MPVMRETQDLQEALHRVRVHVYQARSEAFLGASSESASIQMTVAQTKAASIYHQTTSVSITSEFGSICQEQDPYVQLYYIQLCYEFVPTVPGTKLIQSATLSPSIFRP